MSIPTHWFETFFHGIALDLWRQAIPPEQTIAEAEFLIHHLNCAAGGHLLDVPCGNGRIAIELARRGYRVTGVDIAEEFIDEARTNGALLNRSPATDAADLNPSADFILGDMRHLRGELIYDGAYCFGNSFGFLEYADMEEFLAGIARALKPGARFILNTAMAAESLLPDFEEQSCHEVGEIAVTIKERYLANESCVESEYIFERNGTADTRTARHWVYTVAEIRRMLERAGFTVLSTYRSLKGEPFKLGARELFMVSTVRTPLAC